MKNGIWADVHPMFFGNVNDFPVSFRSSSRPAIYLNAHPKCEKAYGVDVVERIAPQLRDVSFHVYGIQGIDKENVFYHVWEMGLYA